MKNKRHLSQAPFHGLDRGGFVSRGTLVSTEKKPREISRTEKISQTVESRFKTEGGQELELSDEMSAEKREYVVAESRALLSPEILITSHWEALSQFLAGELTNYLSLKKQMNRAQLECARLLNVAEEVCDQANKVSPNRVLEVALSLQEAKMRRDNIRARVQLIADELSAEIAAGLPVEDRESREIRLRGLLAKLA